MSITPLIEALRSALGAAGVLTGDDVDERYSTDWFRHTVCKPPVLLRPATTGELSAALRLCHAHRQAVTVQGGRTGLCGGATPGKGDFALCLERMSGVIDIDPASATLTAWAGTPLQVVQEAASSADMLFAVDFGARGSCHLGGAIATNAGGNRVIRYGMMRAQVLGLEVVLADGTVLTNLNRMLKANAGYDLKQIFIGSEGTLGVVTQAVVRLHPKPRSHCAALCALASYEDVVALLRHAQSSLGGMVTGFEVMWPDYYGTVARVLPSVALPLPADGQIHVLIDLLGSDQASDGERFQAMLETAFERGIVADAAVSQSIADAESYWAVRDAVAEMPLAWGAYEAFDISLPIGEIGRFVEQMVEEVSAQFPGAECVNFGHVGDGNLHMGVKLPDRSKADQLDLVVYRLVARFRGSISAEHGIGTHKIPYLHYSKTPAELSAMQVLKQAYDPFDLLNPGKVLPVPAPTAAPSLDASA